MFKPLCVFLAAVLLLCTLSIAAAAQDDSLFTFSELDDGTLSIASCDTSAAGSITVPAEHDGKQVKAIGRSAFSNCTDIEDITIENGVEQIFYVAFDNCTSLRQINLPATICDFGGNLGNTPSLVSIAVADGSESFRSVDGVVFSADKKVLVTFPGGISSDEYVVPEGTQTIGQHAFCESRVKCVVLPESLELIDDCAFVGSIVPERIEFKSDSIRFFNDSFDKSITLVCEKYTDIHYQLTLKEYENIETYKGENSREGLSYYFFKLFPLFSFFSHFAEMMKTLLNIG